MLPPWLAPEQIKLIPVGETFFDYAKQLELRLRKEGFRVSADLGDDRMNAKIRDAQNQKIPYMLVIGDKEVENGQVALRLRNGENIGALTVAAFIERALSEVAQKV